MKRARVQGFTLAEVLVAMLILSIMSITAIAGLNAVIRAQSQQVNLAQDIQALQFTYGWLSQDLNEWAERGVLNPAGEPLPALMLSGDNDLRQVGLPGQILLVLTRGGINDPQRRVSLQRVAYVWQDNQLLRYTWSVLDAAPNTQPQADVLLYDVARIVPRYLSSAGIYYSQWQDSEEAQQRLPQAIEWQITDNQGTQVTWLFPLIGQADANISS